MFTLNGRPVTESPVLAMLQRFREEDRAHHEPLPYIALRSLLLVRMVDEATGSFSRCDSNGHISARIKPGHIVQFKAIYPEACRLIDQIRAYGPA